MSAPGPKAGTTTIARPNPAIHSEMASIPATACPISHQTGRSRAKGAARVPSTAQGITTRDTSGRVRALPTRPKGWTVWKW